MDILGQVDDSNIFFVDELGFSVSMRSRRGRSLKGTRVVQVVPGLRSRNLSVCCAMSKSKIAKYLPQTFAFNTILFYNFIDILQDHIESLNIGSFVFVMDKLPFHKSNSIRQVIENRGNRLLLLQP